MKCHKCGGPQYYSGGCNGEWECYGECSRKKDDKMTYRCKCGKFIADSDMGICNPCQAKLEKEEAEKVNLRDEYPKIEGWCDIRHLHTKWKCPNGCPTIDGEDGEEYINHGYVKIDETIEYYCYHCEYRKKYKVALQLIGGPEK